MSFNCKKTSMCGSKLLFMYMIQASFDDGVMALPWASQAPVSLIEVQDFPMRAQPQKEKGVSNSVFDTVFGICDCIAIMGFLISKRWIFFPRIFKVLSENTVSSLLKISCQTPVSSIALGSIFSISFLPRYSEWIQRVIHQVTLALPVKSHLNSPVFYNIRLLSKWVSPYGSDSFITHQTRAFFVNSDTLNLK